MYVPRQLYRFHLSTANVYFKNMPDNMAVVEGEKLTIHCIAFGTDPVISWLIGKWPRFDVDDDDDSSDCNDAHPIGVLSPFCTDDKVYSEVNPNAKLSADANGIENAILTIDNAVLEDRANYSCVAVNDAILYGNAKYEMAKEATYVRVKGSCDYK